MTEETFEPYPPVDTSVPPGSGRLGRATVAPQASAGDQDGRDVFDIAVQDLHLSPLAWELLGRIATYLALTKAEQILALLFSGILTDPTAAATDDAGDGKKGAGLAPGDVAKLRGFLGLTDPAAASPSPH